MLYFLVQLCMSMDHMTEFCFPLTITDTDAGAVTLVHSLEILSNVLLPCMECSEAASLF